MSIHAPSFPLKQMQAPHFITRTREAYQTIHKVIQLFSALPDKELYLAKDIYPSMKTLFEFYFDRYELTGASLQEVHQWFSTHKTLLHICQHGPVHSPFVMVPAFYTAFCEFGGGDRTAISLGHRKFYEWPYFSKVWRFITSSSKSYSFAELAQAMRKGEISDVIIAPEGSNCIYGKIDQIRPFLSHRYVELAVRTQSPMILITFLGLEKWAQAVQSTWLHTLGKALPKHIYKAVGLRKSRFLDLLEQNDYTLSFPVGIPKQSVLKLHVNIFHPSLRIEDLNAPKLIAKERIAQESEKIRERMAQALAAKHKSAA